jgi:diketogulonate reductase-like aldo/keto reductase
MNEEAVGRGIKQSGAAREKLFITTKLWIQSTSHENMLKAFERSLIACNWIMLTCILSINPMVMYMANGARWKNCTSRARSKPLAFPTFSLTASWT